MFSTRSNTVFVTDLNKQSEIIFLSLFFNTFKASVFLRDFGSCKKWLEPKTRPGANLKNVQRLGLRLRLKKPLAGMDMVLRLTVIF